MRLILPDRDGVLNLDRRIGQIPGGLVLLPVPPRRWRA
jgi:hypothetical protein